MGHFPASGGGGGSGTIEEITSTGATVTVVDPTGPITDLEVAGGGGAVASVFGRTGVVTAQSGDYSAFFDALGAAAAAQSAAIATATAFTTTTTRVLTGLVGDNGVTDNYAGGFGGGSPLDLQLTALSTASGGPGGAAVVPSFAGLVGIGTDLKMSNYPGVSLWGRGPYLSKSPGTNGRIAFGSGFGPTGAGTYTRGIVVLDSPGAVLRNLVVNGIVNVPGTGVVSAACSVYVTGPNTNVAARIYDCNIGAGSFGGLVLDTGSDDLLVVNTELNAGAFTGTQAVGTNPAGCNLIVGASADHSFVRMQTFNGPNQIGCGVVVTPPWGGTITGGGNDDNFIGCHFSSPGEGVPSHFANTSTGYNITGGTMDNGSANALCHIERHSGSVNCVGTRFQNGQGEVDTGCTTQGTTTVLDPSAVTGFIGYPISSSDGGIPTGATITGQTVGVSYTISAPATTSVGGLTFTIGGYPVVQDDGTNLNQGMAMFGCNFSLSTGAPFRGLINQLGSTQNANHQLVGLTLQPGSFGPQTNRTPTLWTAGVGVPTTTLVPGLARSIMLNVNGGAAVLQPELPATSFNAPQLYANATLS